MKQKQLPNSLFKNLSFLLIPYECADEFEVIQKYLMECGRKWYYHGTNTISYKNVSFKTGYFKISPQRMWLEISRFCDNDEHIISFTDLLKAVSKGDTIINFDIGESGYTFNVTHNTNTRTVKLPGLTTNDVPEKLFKELADTIKLIPEETLKHLRHLNIDGHYLTPLNVLKIADNINKNHLIEDNITLTCPIS